MVFRKKVVVILCALFSFSLTAMKKQLEKEKREKNLKDMRIAIRNVDYNAFADEFYQHKISGCTFLSNGDTPLTLLVKNWNHVKGQEDKGEVDVTYFLTFLFNQLNKQFNQVDQAGNYPIEVACNHGIFDAAVYMIKRGAKLSFCKKNLLNQKRHGKILINELTKSYVDSYCTFVKAFKEQKVDTRICEYRCNLEEIIDLYISNGYTYSVINEKDNAGKDLLCLLCEGENKILKELVDVKKRVLYNVCIAFIRVFERKVEETKACSAIVEYKSIISGFFNKMIGALKCELPRAFVRMCKLKRALAKQQFHIFLLRSAQTNKFVDAEIICET